MQVVKNPAHRKLLEMKLDIRQMADKMVQDEGKIDLDGVKAMLSRATDGGKVDKKCMQDLAYVRERYKDKFTAVALKVLSGALGPFVADQMKKMKEKERQSKIDRQVLKLEEHQEFLKKDRKLRDMEVGDKQRVLLTSFFGRSQSV